MSTPAAWADLVAGLRDIATIRVAVEVEVSGDAVVPGPEVLSAFDRAAREAIRNAAKHAGVDTVEVRLELDRRRARLTVTDRGAGFPVESDRLAAGHGLQHSIVAPLAGVGGQAELTSSQGAGTRVTLTWQEPAGLGDLLQRSYDAIPPVGRGVFLGVAIPMVTANLVLAVAEQLADPQTPAMWAMMAAGVGLVLWTGVRLRRPPSVGDVALLAVAVAALTAIAIFLSGPAALATMASWYVGFYSFALAVMAFVVPGRLLPLLLGPQVALVAGVSIATPEVGPTGFGAVNSVLLPAAVGWALGAFLRRSGRTMQARQQELARLLARTAAEREATELRRRHLEDAADDIGPFLHDVAEGRLDPAAPETRAVGGALAQLSRDDLYAPGYFDPHLRRLAREFRIRGGRLRIGEGVPPHAADRSDGQLLAQLLPRLEGAVEVAMTLRPWEPLPGRLVVVPGLPEEILQAVAPACRSWGVELESSEHQTLFRLPLPAEASAS